MINTKWGAVINDIPYITSVKFGRKTKVTSKKKMTKDFSTEFNEGLSCSTVTIHPTKINLL